MNTINRVFLKIMNAALSGASAPDLLELSPEEWMSLVKLADEQKVMPLFYDCIYAQAPLDQLRGMVRRQVMVQAVKTDAFLKLYQRWEQAGVSPIVVKGIVCRNLYRNPDYRPSSDEDVLVDPNQFDDAVRVLEEFGMFTDENASGAYELPYKSADSPLFVEVHKSLFPSESESYGHWNDLFSSVFETSYYESINGVSVRTMPPTEHMFYLLCHALKHFVHSGFGIRQICDIILFGNRWGKNIDWHDLMQKCSYIRADKFASAIFRIGAEYLIFDMDRACYPEFWREIQTDPTDLLDDIFSGGIYGTASISRVHSSNMTLDAVADHEGQGSGKPSVLRSVFPPSNKISGQYPYLRKHPWLLPAAWIHRIFKYGKELRSSGAESAMESVKIGTQRIELLRQYGVIK